MRLLWLSEGGVMPPPPVILLLMLFVTDDEQGGSRDDNPLPLDEGNTKLFEHVLGIEELDG